MNTVQTNVVIGIGEPDQPELSMIKLGPNPFVSQLKVDYNCLAVTRLTIRVTDMNGTPVNTGYESDITPGLHHIDLDGHSLKPGIYLVQFNTTNGKPVLFKVVRMP